MIPAAGSGRRFGASLEKQFLTLQGKPLLAHTLKPFQESPLVSKIVLVVPSRWVAELDDFIIRPYGFDKVGGIVPGGERRQDSVRLGLESLKPEWDIVMIHDGARPLVTPSIIERSVLETLKYGATFAGVPATDTIKEVDSEGRVVKTIPRKSLCMVQTPQSFSYDLILEAHRTALKDGYKGTDDASLVEYLEKEVRFILGAYENIKITGPKDLSIAEDILERRAKGDME